MRLLFGEMYPRRLAEQLRAEGHDVVAVVELPDLVGREDAEVARWACERGRVVVTENVVDYAPLDVDEHAGLLLVDARRWPRTPSGLPRLLTALRCWIDARTGEGSTERGAHLVEWLQEPDRRNTSAGQRRPLEDLLGAGPRAAQPVGECPDGAAAVGRAGGCHAASQMKNCVEPESAAGQLVSASR